MTSPHRRLVVLLLLVSFAPWAPAAPDVAASTARKPLRPSLEALPEQRISTTEAEEHYGVPQGRCNRLMVGAVLGGTIAPGDRIGGGGERATPVARLTGKLLGGDTHAEVADAERGCAQQVLEFGVDDRPVAWRHGELRFRMTPGRAESEGDNRCRRFEFVAQGGTLAGRLRGRACRRGDAGWEIRQ